jgi:hypothetical protein
MNRSQAAHALVGYALVTALVGATLWHVPWSTLGAATGLGEPTYDQTATAARATDDIQAQSHAEPAAQPQSPWQGKLHVTDWGRTFRVVDVSRGNDGALVPPDDVLTLGRWNHGARPGTGTGTVVLVVHRDSNSQGRGPFAALERLPLGSDVTLDRQTYRLDQVETYPKGDLPSERAFRQHGPERLVIVTCGGSFSQTRGWDSNLVASFSLES